MPNYFELSVLSLHPLLILTLREAKNQVQILRFAQNDQTFLSPLLNDPVLLGSFRGRALILA